MASVRKDIPTAASPESVWAAIRDIGAVHRRLVPGFVTDTRLEPGARIVTFGTGAVIREPIVTVDDAAMRLVWAAEGGRTTHYNASLQVCADGDGGSQVTWIADFLPHDVAADSEAMMSAGAAAMTTALDHLV